MDSSSSSDSAVVLSYAETKAKFGDLFSAPAFIVFEVIVVSACIFCLVLSRLESCHRIHFLAVGYVAGFLGGQQNMFLKGVGTFIGTAIAGDASVFSDWLVYVFILGMVSLASTQLFFLNEGLAQFPALLFVPTYTILYIVSGTLVGLVFYQEYKLMNTLGWIMFAIGFFLIGCAMVILGLKEDTPVEPVLTECDPNCVTPIKVIDTGELYPDMYCPTPPFMPPTVGIGGENSLGSSYGSKNNQSPSLQSVKHNMPPTPASLQSGTLSLGLERSHGSGTSALSRPHSFKSHADVVNFPSFSSTQTHACLGMSGALMIMTDSHHDLHHHLPGKRPSQRDKRPAAKPPNTWVEESDSPTNKDSDTPTNQ